MVIYITCKAQCLFEKYFSTSEDELGVKIHKNTKLNSKTTRLKSVSETFLNLLCNKRKDTIPQCIRNFQTAQYKNTNWLATFDVKENLVRSLCLFFGVNSDTTCLTEDIHRYLHTLSITILRHKSLPLVFWVNLFMSHHFFKLFDE